MTTSICNDCNAVFDDAAATQCPDCDSKDYGYPEEDKAYCPNELCDYYLEAQDTTSPHCEHCSGTKKTRLIQGSKLNVLIPEKEEQLTKGDRQLKALIRNAQSFISSSGTHHRSKGGKHTASAQEKHSKAMGSKEQVRTSYAVQLREAIEAASDKKLKQEGEAMVKKVEAK